MSRKIKDLVDVLKTKNQDDEVEYIVISVIDGALIGIDVEMKAKDISKLVEMFKYER